VQKWKPNESTTCLGYLEVTGDTELDFLGGIWALNSRLAMTRERLVNNMTHTGMNGH